MTDSKAANRVVITGTPERRTDPGKHGRVAPFDPPAPTLATPGALPWRRR